MARRQLDRTLTIRLDGRSARALQELAQARRRSTSELVRGWIVAEVGTLQGPTALELSEKYVGAIKSGPVSQGRRARELLEDWNPDRRG